MLVKCLQNEELYLFGILRITASNKQLESRKPEPPKINTQFETVEDMYRIVEATYKIRKLFKKMAFFIINYCDNRPLINDAITKCQNL